jgi:hypothetical protein
LSSAKRHFCSDQVLYSETDEFCDSDVGVVRAPYDGAIDDVADLPVNVFNCESTRAQPSRDLALFLRHLDAVDEHPIGSSKTLIVEFRLSAVVGAQCGDVLSRMEP